MWTRNLTLAAASLFAVCFVAAGQERKLSCDGQRGGSGGETACEMRETAMTASGRLEVEAAPNGSIRVQGWEGTEILVRAQVRANAGTRTEAEAMLKEVRVETSDSKIRSDGPKSNGWAGKNNWWSVSFEVFVPKEQDLALHSVNGGISVSQVSGRLTARTVNGAPKFAEVAGTVNGETVNGGISMALDGSTWKGEGIDLRTVNGGVKLNVPEAYSARIEASTVHGGLSADFGGEMKQSDRANKRVSLTLGSGGPLVKLRTVNGGVSVKKAS